MPDEYVTATEPLAKPVMPDTPVLVTEFARVVSVHAAPSAVLPTASLSDAPLMYEMQGSGATTVRNTDDDDAESTATGVCQVRPVLSDAATNLTVPSAAS